MKLSTNAQALANNQKSMSTLTYTVYRGIKLICSNLPFGSEINKTVLADAKKERVAGRNPIYRLTRSDGVKKVGELIKGKICWTTIE